MIITVKQVFSDSAITIGYKPVQGYWIDFKSECVCGRAIFVPSNPDPVSQLCGQTFFTEANHDRIENFQRHGDDSIHTASLVPLSKDGNFHFVGQVRSVLPLADKEKQTLIVVAAGDFLITLMSDEIENNVPEVGEVVSFDIIELSLWDENI